jgi:hypothetical protein
VFEDLHAGEVEQDQEQVDQDEGSEAAHPEAIDELLTIARTGIRPASGWPSIRRGRSAGGHLRQVTQGRRAAVSRSSPSFSRSDGTQVSRSSRRGGQAPARGHGEPAFDLAGPGDANELVGDARDGAASCYRPGTGRGVGGLVVPPGGQAEDALITADEVDAGLVRVGRPVSTWCNQGSSSRSARYPCCSSPPR